MNATKVLEDRFLDTCSKLNDLKVEVGSSGNLSFRAGDQLMITPSGASYADINLNSNVKVDLKTLKVRSPSPKPSSDMEAHAGIYSLRSDVKAIVHTHSHYVTLSSMIYANIPVLNTMHADYFGTPIKCLPFSNHRKTGFGPTELFEKGSAFLLGKHGGLLLFSKNDPQKIADTLMAFNEVCRLYYDYLSVAHNLQEEISEISDDDLGYIHQYYKQEYGNANK